MITKKATLNCYQNSKNITIRVHLNRIGGIVTSLGRAVTKIKILVFSKVLNDKNLKNMVVLPHTISRREESVIILDKLQFPRHVKAHEPPSSSLRNQDSNLSKV
jgi:hypothetical protein